MTDILVITGLSGAGRSEAADDLEDLGWFVVDNLPTSLIEKVAELGGGRGSSIGRLALVVGSGTHQADILEVIGRLRAAGHRVRVLFLEAATPVLVSRYGSTRRKHPLSDGSQSVLDLIEQERELLEPVRAMADLVIDTTDLNVHQLKARLRDVFGPEGSEGGMQTAITSFGYKHGLPLDVDLVLDCRFLPNPYWVEGLRHQSGLDDEVREYVLAQQPDAGLPLPARRPPRPPAAGLRAPRARATSRSPSAAPAASTARWRSPRRSPAAGPTRYHAAAPAP